jgi:hypothetical protein
MLHFCFKNILCLAIEQPRENLFHLCSRHNLIKLCEILLKLPGSTEALENLNTKGEQPIYLAMKNNFDQIADLM